MRLGCLSTLLPGETTGERFSQAVEIGLEALEFLVFPDTDLAAWLEEIQEGSAVTGLGVCALIACQNLLDPSHLPWFKEVLEVAAEVGAVVVVTPEYAGRNPPAGMPPLPPPPEGELEMVRELISQMASYAQRLGARLAVEAINRYETRFARSLGEAVALAEGAGSEVGVLADFFHLNIEERDIDASLRRAGRRLAHVHLADSNRSLPGYGHLDFARNFRTLIEMAYEGALSLECGLPEGDPEALTNAVKWLRATWRLAASA